MANKPGYKPPPRGKLPGRVKADADKLTPGRPRKQPPADALDVIREATAKGASMDGVAMALGVNRAVLTRWMDERPNLAEAFRHGREKERQVLHSKLRELADSGNVVALLFLLKSRHGYREGDQEAQANRVSINFQIPGAMPLNKFMVIENEPDNRTE